MIKTVEDLEKFGGDHISERVRVERKEDSERHRHVFFYLCDVEKQ